MPHVSLIRYPGGKSALAPLVYSIMQDREQAYDVFIEPFAGGAGCGLSLLFAGKIKKLVLNEFDVGVYSVLRAGMEEPERFCGKIESTVITQEEWEKQHSIFINNASEYSFDLGFATWFLCRTNFSGILLNKKPTPTRKGGGTLEEKFYSHVTKEGLKYSILRIAERKEDIELYNLDVCEFIKTKLYFYPDSFVFFDPPYYKADNKLYNTAFSDGQHEAFSFCVREVSQDWLITYDNAPYIKSLYKDYPQYEVDVKYTVRLDRKKTRELLITKAPIRCPLTLSEGYLFSELSRIREVSA